jgi:hypothetical protein
MPYLNQNYSEFLSKYYNEMNLLADSSNSNMNYNNLQHLYSYCNELKVHKYTLIYYILHESYILTFLHPLQLFLKLSKFLKSRLYQLVLVSTILTFLIDIIDRIFFNAYYNYILYSIPDVITIIILIFRKYWKSRPQLVFLCYTAIIVHSFINSPIIIILFFRKYWKSQTQLIFMIFIFLITNSRFVKIMFLMNIFSRKYCKSHPVLVFLIYIVGILSLIISIVFEYNGIIVIILTLIITHFAKYPKSQLFPILIIIGDCLYLLTGRSTPLLLVSHSKFPKIIGHLYDLLEFLTIEIIFFIVCFIICSCFIKIIFNEQKTKPKLTFLVPFPGYVTYPKDYNFLEELIKSQSSPFSQTQNNELYKTWNGEAIINFKWRVFGRYYYAGIWILFIIYLTCFTLASIPYDIFNNEDRKKFFFSSIIFGFIHLLFEVRQ